MEQRPQHPEAVAQRHGLRARMADLSVAVHAPVDSTPEWAPRVVEALEALRIALARHTEFTEAPDGLFADIVAQAPRLVNAVRHLEAEHGDLAERLEGCEEMARTLGDGMPIGETVTRIGDLITRLERHQDRGVELVYDAYNVDISPGD